MTYIVKVQFADLQDGKRLYKVGETFPRDGLTVTNERLESLSGSDNRAGMPLIESVGETAQESKESEKSPRKRVRKDVTTDM